MTATSCESTTQSSQMITVIPPEGNTHPGEGTEGTASPWAAGIAMVLAASVLQRVIGFVRSAWFCRWLDAKQLGTWDLAFAFLMTATPLVVLALPGCLGRYVEHFQQKGVLGPFLRRLALVQGSLAAVTAILMTIFTKPIATTIFGSAMFAPYVYLLACGLVIVAWFNYFYELTTALRLSRWIAGLQLVNSILFAVFGIGLLGLWRRSAEFVIIAYLLACTVTTVCALVVVRPWLFATPSTQLKPANDRIWAKVIWYSLGLWATGTVGNLFAVVDRYMIVHFLPSGGDALTQVGDYHAARLVPVLLVSFAGLVGTLSLPHLSHAWELGRRDWCRNRLAFLLKILAIALLLAETGILLGRPIIFEWLLAGRYPAAHAILPLILLASGWFSLFFILQNYVLCCEKAHWAALAMAAGLAANIVLNILWLPIWGLHGAVAATAVANGLALTILAVVSHRLGFSSRSSLIWPVVIPLSLVAGTGMAIIASFSILVLALATPWYFTAAEKREIYQFYRQIRALRFLGRNSSSGQKFWKDSDECPPGLGTQGQGPMKWLQPAFTDDPGRAWPNPFLRKKNHPPLGQRGPLRVMFVITCMPVGGAERLLVEIVRRLDRTKIQPELCCLKYPGPLGELLAKEIPTFSGLLSHKYDLRVLPRLWWLLRKRNVDAVITVGTGGDKMFWGRLAAFFAGVPVIASALHSTGLPDRVEWLNRILAPLTDAFIAVARPHAEFLVSEEGCSRNRTWVIPNGVDTDRFSPRPPNPQLRQNLGLPPESSVVTIVAALRPEKNHELFLRAAAAIQHRFENVHFLIVGDGPRRKMLEELADDLGVRDVVHFLGVRDDIPEILGMTDVVVLSSHMEANPLSILEAMACAKPVVATRVGSVPTNVIDGLTGFLVPPEDALALAERCGLLLSSAQLREEMGRAARRHVLQHASLELTVKGYEGLILDLYCRKCGGTPSEDGDRPNLSSPLSAEITMEWRSSPKGV
ncbi:MAG: glycosyltransferase [Thermogutta sp.]